MDVTTLTKDEIIAKDRVLIHGFHRDIEKELPYTTPIEILNLILSYFQLCLHAKNCAFDESKQILTVESRYDIAYFTSMISWSKGRHVLEIKCIDTVTNLGIGICSNYLEGYKYDYFLEADECGLSYFIKLNCNSRPSFCHFQDGAQKYRQFASNAEHHWNSKDSVIRVEYDLDSMQISYFIDDVLQNDFEQPSKSAIYDIRKCDEYYFAFYCYSGNRFEIITCS